jgi:DNA-binding CsgD family transcriptional regulator/tetratricopeptide (TPR) repeat protein
MEQQVLDRVVRDAVGGAGGAHMLRGPPGVGKTTLLHACVDEFTESTSILVECVELDERLPYAALRPIVTALASSLAELPPDRAEMLRAVCTGQGAAPLDPAAAGAATLLLVSAAATSQPVLLVIDDAQWIGSSSGDALNFVARRLGDERVCMLAATRELEGGALGRGLPSTRLEGLSPIDIALMLGNGVATRTAEELTRITGGNPLAVLETASKLSDEQRRGAAPLGRMPRVSAELVQAFRDYLAPLDAAVAAALLLAATEPALDLTVLRAALASAGHAGADLEHGLPTELARVHHDRVVFRHPLLRESTYEGATPEDRRRAHLLVAECLGSSGNLERRAWHLAAAAQGYDEDAAVALEGAAASASASGDRRAAAAMLERAAALSAGDDNSARRLGGAGRALAADGDDVRAVQVFDAALEKCSTPLERDGIIVERAMAEIHTGRVESVPTILDGVVSRNQEAQPELAAAALAIAGYATMVAYGPAAAEERLVNGLASRSDRDGPANPLVLGLLAFARQQRGASDVGDDLRAVADQLRVIGLGPHVTGIADSIANALFWTDDFTSASRLLDDLVQSGREHSSMTMLAYTMSVRAGLYIRTGHWQAALADAVEAHDLALETKPALASYPLAERARVEGMLGRFGVAREHAGQAIELSDSMGVGSLRWLARGTMALVELCAGNIEESIVHAELADGWAYEHGIRSFGPVLVLPDLVEAYVRTGRTDHARQRVATLEADAIAAQSSFSAALFGRCRGLVDDDYVPTFEEALCRHAEVPAPFETARTQLCYGERLRRDRDPRQATHQLAAAADTFARLEAQPWLDRAEAELAACSASAERPRPRVPPASGLTPQEYRVAETVASGLTSKDAAAALFVSPRTVDSHLTNIYRKLGIHSRVELANFVRSLTDST